MGLYEIQDIFCFCSRNLGMYFKNKNGGRKMLKLFMFKKMVYDVYLNLKEMVYISI